MADNQEFDMNFAGPIMFSFQLCAALVAKGVFTKAEASKVMIDTAEMVRMATEGERDEAAGERAARGYEQLAAWLQGQKGNIP